MAFDAASLLSDLFPEQQPAKAPAEPAKEQHSLLPAPSPSPHRRPVNRLSGALQTPPLPEWRRRWKRAPELTLPPKPCWWCGCSVFWQSMGRAWFCANCKKTCFPERVTAWVEVVATDDGPQVVLLAECQVESRLRACRNKRRGYR